jgi:hypothetical protein
MWNIQGWLRLLDLIPNSIHNGTIHEKAKQLLEKAGKGWGFLEI